MRAESYAEHRKALAAARQEMTAEHHRQQERLRSQVSKREEEAARRVETVEASAYAERQKLLGDLEAIRRRESDSLAQQQLRQRAESEKAGDVRRQAETLGRTRETLERRENELDRLREEYRASASREAPAARSA